MSGWRNSQTYTMRHNPARVLRRASSVLAVCLQVVATAAKNTRVQTSTAIRSYVARVNSKVLVHYLTVQRYAWCSPHLRPLVHAIGSRRLRQRRGKHFHRPPCLQLPNSGFIREPCELRQEAERGVDRMHRTPSNAMTSSATQASGEMHSSRLLQRERGGGRCNPRVSSSRIVV